MYVVLFQQLYIFVEQLNKLCNVCNETLFAILVKYSDLLQLKSKNDWILMQFTYLQKSDMVTQIM